METKVTPMAWSPMAGGRIGLDAGAARADAGGERLAQMLETLDAIAGEQNVSRSAVALAWILAHPAGVIPIIGTQRLERIRESIDAVKVQLTRTQWNDILVAAQGEPLP